MHNKDKVIAELENLLVEIQLDLMERAEEDSFGFMVVGLGNGLWTKLKRYNEAK